MRRHKKKFHKSPRYKRAEALVDSLLGIFETKGKISLNGWK